MRLIISVVVIVACFTPGNGYSQLCTGSLGDPVINITFGQGSNPGPPLVGGITSYGYLSTSCPGDGFYNIGTSTSNCFGDTWHTVIEDHTPGDVNGYMMIINASNDPGVFYVDTVKGLCGGTTYEFAAWILNIIKSTSCGSNTIAPNITFEIETISGTNLLTYKTGNILPGTPEWKQYGAFFSTPVGESKLVLRMTNNANGGCGNDLLLDDITFRPCGAKVDASFAGALSVVDLCKGDNQAVTMSATVSQADNNTLYQWQISANGGISWSDINGATGKTYTRPGGAATIASYLYRLTVAQGSNISIPTCRIASAPLSINVNPLPVAAAFNNGPKCEGDTLTLSVADGQSFAWTGPNGYNSTARFATISPLKTNDAGKYYVVLTSAKGCTNKDSTLVVVNSKVNANAGNDVTICQGNSTNLRGGTGVSYLWSPALGLSETTIAAPLAKPDTTTVYQLTVSNGQCKASDTVRVTVLKSPKADAGLDLKIMQGQSVSLNGTTSGDKITFFWTPAYRISNSQTLKPLVTPIVDTTYTLHVVSTMGCGTATDNVFVRVFKSIKIPNAFSPNGDGINDVWQIEDLDTYPEADLLVFNRYGRLIYQAKGNSNFWNGTYNGKPLPVGMYYYVLDLKNGLAKKSGSVLIVK